MVNWYFYATLQKLSETFPCESNQGLRNLKSYIFDGGEILLGFSLRLLFNREREMLNVFGMLKIRNNSNIQQQKKVIVYQDSMYAARNNFKSYTDTEMTYVFLYKNQKGNLPVPRH